MSRTPNVTEYLPKDAKGLEALKDAFGKAFMDRCKGLKPNETAAASLILLSWAANFKQMGSTQIQRRALELLRFEDDQLEATKEDYKKISELVDLSPMAGMLLGRCMDHFQLGCQFAKVEDRMLVNKTVCDAMQVLIDILEQVLKDQKSE